MKKSTCSSYVLFFVLSRSHTISSIYILPVGNKFALRNKSYLPNHICYASVVYLGRKLTFTPTVTAICLVLLTDQFVTFFSPKDAWETNATSNTPTTWKTYEFPRHRCLIAPRITQENVKQTHVGVSATYVWLENRVRDCNQDPHFEVSEKMMQINKNPELFCPVLPFFGPNDVQALTAT